MVIASFNFGRFSAVRSSETRSSFRGATRARMTSPADTSSARWCRADNRSCARSVRDECWLLRPSRDPMVLKGKSRQSIIALIMRRRRSYSFEVFPVPVPDILSWVNRFVYGWVPWGWCREESTLCALVHRSSSRLLLHFHLPRNEVLPSDN